LPTENRCTDTAAGGKNLGVPLAQTLVRALADRGLKYRVVALSEGVHEE
jgi:hypothetical protein